MENLVYQAQGVFLEHLDLEENQESLDSQGQQDHQAILVYKD